jgi:hypothetical protein
MKKRKLGKRYREMDAQIVVALVGGGFAVLVALISKIGSDNKKDHGQVHQTLGRIEEKIDNHVENHS